MRQGTMFPAELPPGFAVVEEAITRADEQALIAFAGALSYAPFVLMGQPSLRDTAVFGADYSPSSPRLSGAPAIPAELHGVRAIVTRAFGEDPDRYVQSVVTRYPPGSGIGWHADYRVFGPAVLGVSLGAPCRFRLRRKAEPRSVVTVELPPRSIYVMRGPARARWQHAISAVRDLRYSITFRSLAA